MEFTKDQLKTSIGFLLLYDSNSLTRDGEASYGIFSLVSWTWRASLVRSNVRTLRDSGLRRPVLDVPCCMSGEVSYASAYLAQNFQTTPVPLSAAAHFSKAPVSCIWCAESNSCQSDSMPDSLSKMSFCRDWLKASVSGILESISCTSSGREAFMFSTRKSCKLATCSCKTALERIFTCCTSCIWEACTSSATHQALRKRPHWESTATTCEKLGLRAANKAIMSSNLFISQPMLRPSDAVGMVLLKCLGKLQSQRSYGILVTESQSPLGFPPQMPKCWFTEKAQIQ